MYKGSLCNKMSNLILMMDFIYPHRNDSKSSISFSCDMYEVRLSISEARSRMGLEYREINIALYYIKSGKEEEQFNKTYTIKSGIEQPFDIVAKYSLDLSVGGFTNDLGFELSEAK